MKRSYQQRRQVCQSKQYFPSRSAAEQAMTAWPEKAYRVYECDWCDGWHLTSQTRLQYVMEGLRRAA